MISDPEKERRMQLDIWIPKYNLALEYQGKWNSYCRSPC
jgi:hypothetical protein